MEIQEQVINKIPHERFMRQLDIVPPESLTFPITVIGAGAIGSSTVINLMKMGCSNVTVWDDDTVEEHNVPNQFCKLSSIGSFKVDALDELVYDLTGMHINPVNKKYRNQELKGVVIITVDNMIARQIAWKKIVNKFHVPLYIDARMGAEFARIYAVCPSDSDDIKLYEENLYPDTEAERLPCSARSIIYCPSIIGGIIAMMVKQFAMNQPVKKEVLFNIPSFTIL